MDSKKKEKKGSSLPFNVRAFKEDLRISRTKRYAFLAKSQKMATKRVSAPSLDSIFLKMDKIAETIKSEQIKTTKQELTQTARFLTELKEHWKSLITRISFDDSRIDDPETPFPSNFNAYLSKQALVANQIIRMRSKYQRQSKKVQKQFLQLSALRGRSI